MVETLSKKWPILKDNEELKSYTDIVK